MKINQRNFIEGVNWWIAKQHENRYRWLCPCPPCSWSSQKNLSSPSVFSSLSYVAWPQSNYFGNLKKIPKEISRDPNLNARNLPEEFKGTTQLLTTLKGNFPFFTRILINSPKGWLLFLTYFFLMAFDKRFETFLISPFSSF